MSSLEQVTRRPIAVSRDRSRAVFGQTMGLVALTCLVAGIGAYLGRDISHGWGIVAFMGAIACIIGLSAAPALAYYASVQPQALWQAAGTTALFIAGFGAFGYATRRDLSIVGRISFFALLGPIVFMLLLSLFGGGGRS
jgi:FtsH-binding integral membrane protein